MNEAGILERRNGEYREYEISQEHTILAIPAIPSKATAPLCQILSNLKRLFHPHMTLASFTNTFTRPTTCFSTTSCLPYAHFAFFTDTIISGVRCCSETATLLFKISIGQRENGTS